MLRLFFGDRLQCWTGQAGLIMTGKAGADERQR